MAKQADQETIKRLISEKQGVDLKVITELLDGACPGCGLSLRRPEGYPPKWYSIFHRGNGGGGELFCKKCIEGFEEVHREYEKKKLSEIKGIIE